MTPTLVLKDGKPTLVTGSPGGARIITTVLQQIVNGIDFGMNPAEAAATVRFHHQWMPDELRVEKGFSPDTLHLLRQKGQNVVVKPAMAAPKPFKCKARRCGATPTRATPMGSPWATEPPPTTEELRSKRGGFRYPNLTVRAQPH